MTLRDAILEACQLLREGAAVEPLALQQLQEQLESRHRQFEQELQAAALPPGLETLEDLLHQSFAEFQEALDGLAVGFAEDAPEIAAWVQEKTQDAEETLRQVRQSLEEYSAMLCEESN